MFRIAIKRLKPLKAGMSSLLLFPAFSKIFFHIFFDTWSHGLTCVSPDRPWLRVEPLGALLAYLNLHCGANLLQVGIGTAQGAAISPRLAPSLLTLNALFSRILHAGDPDVLYFSTHYLGLIALGVSKLCVDPGERIDTSFRYVVVKDLPVAA